MKVLLLLLLVAAFAAAARADDGLVSYDLQDVRDRVYGGKGENITCVVVKAKHAVECDGVEYESEAAETIGAFSKSWFIYAGASLGLVLSAGLFSGLTMGLMSLDLMNLEILSRSGTDKEQRHARKIIPVVKRHHLLLVTLLLANAGAMEALPLMLDKLVSPAVAIVLSVTLVLVFGEVLPQAICSRYGLAIGANMAWMVKILMLLLLPIAWPIAKLLDLVLGTGHATFFRRSELKELVTMHGLTPEEVDVIRGAIDLQGKIVGDAMTPLDDVFMLDINGVLDEAMMVRIMSHGHSRVPLFEGTRANVVAILLVKTLVDVDANKRPRLRDLHAREARFTTSSTPMYAMMEDMKSGGSHLYVVADDPSKALGIITLEDVVEELLGYEIYDETDQSQETQRVNTIMAIASMVRRVNTQPLTGLGDDDDAPPLARAQTLAAINSDASQGIYSTAPQTGMHRHNTSVGIFTKRHGTLVDDSPRTMSPYSTVSSSNDLTRHSSAGGSSLKRQSTLLYDETDANSLDDEALQATHVDDIDFDDDDDDDDGDGGGDTEPEDGGGSSRLYASASDAGRDSTSDLKKSLLKNAM